ncbi:hypothetical protein B5807_08236 [Epicoccum nigrum]|uniref:Uncharacterized protein n=1 Tax=Epicoccum nigrum TaxID=105696 RepID=A0A1Y2LQ08_EPING|nr:hypothetical protein B5807_08236 [Epicoccum nigrum]
MTPSQKVAETSGTGTRDHSSERCNIGFCLRGITLSPPCSTYIWYRWESVGLLHHFASIGTYLNFGLLEIWSELAFTSRDGSSNPPGSWLSTQLNHQRPVLALLLLLIVFLLR